MRTSRAAWRRLRGERRSAPPTDDLRLLSDRELLQRWLRTSAQLRHPGSTPEAAVALVAQRSDLLDELARRDPRGYADRLARASRH